MYMIRHFMVWKLDARKEKALRSHQAKIDAKRQQLVGVQEMFRQFASKLESGLKSTAGDGTTRDWREGKPPTAKALHKGQPDGVSLPDIKNPKDSGREKPGS